MRGFIRYFLGVLAVVAFVLTGSCVRRPLHDLECAHYVRVYLDEEIKNVTMGFYNGRRPDKEYKRPVALEIALADVHTGEVVSKALLRNSGSDGRGNYIDGYVGAEAGIYDVVVYEVGSSVTLLRNEGSFSGIAAYTNTINDRLMGYIPSLGWQMDTAKLVVQPDHLFHAVYEDLEIPAIMQVDTLRDANGEYFRAHTVVKSYYLQLSIVGARWVSSAVAVLSGMGGSTLLGQHNGVVESESVSLFFWAQHNEEYRQLYTTFNTFGKLENAKSVLELNFEFTKIDGSSQVEVMDITEVFNTPAVRDNQWILIDKEIVITSPKNTGGMQPGVGGWKDFGSDLPM